MEVIYMCNQIIMFRHISGRQFPIIVNPTDKDYTFIKERFQDRCPFAPKGEPYSRSTYDKEGNTYLWCSDDSMHYLVEKFINEKFNTLCNQNEYYFD
jgi:hypothetical protein